MFIVKISYKEALMGSTKTYVDLAKEAGGIGGTLRKCATIDYLFGDDEIAQREDIREIVCPESWGIPKDRIESLRERMGSQDIVPYNVYMRISTTMPSMETHDAYVPVFREKFEASEESLQQRLELVSVCIASEFKTASVDAKQQKSPFSVPGIVWNVGERPVRINGKHFDGVKLWEWMKKNLRDGSGKMDVLGRLECNSLYNNLDHLAYTKMPPYYEVASLYSENCSWSNNLSGTSVWLFLGIPLSNDFVK